MRIEQVDLELQREPFARPFGFKGSCFHEKWNAVVRLTGEDGARAVGVGGLAPLWADASVFLAHTENGGNFVMLCLLERALQAVKGRSFADPFEMLDAVLPEVHAYGKTVTENPDLRPTFTLNALVALDFAAWSLFAREQGATTFDALIPEAYAAVLPARADSVTWAPVVAYKTPVDEIRRLLDEGSYLLKIKVGQSGDEAEMLRKDAERMARIHELATGCETPHTECGRPIYYLDANGRYRTKDAILRLLDGLDRIGALERVALFEEPFAEEVDMDVHDVPARLAADESVHSPEDVARRLEQGYRAIAIKPAGKTLSMAFRMIAAVAEGGAPCFVADNACVPILVDWNKNVAARLPAFPGLRACLMESNGPTSYPDWDALLADHPCAGADWLKPREGAFHLSEEFYARSGGVLMPPTPFVSLFRETE